MITAWTSEVAAQQTEDGQLVYSAWRIRNEGTTVPHLAAVMKILRPQAATPCGSVSAGGPPASVWSERSNRMFNR